MALENKLAPKFKQFEDYPLDENGVPQDVTDITAPPVTEQVTPETGVPTVLTDAAQSPLDKFQAMLQDPTQQAAIAQMSGAGPTPDQKALMDKLTQRGQASLDAQQQGINENSQDIENFKNGPQPINWQPANKLVDYLTGSQNAQGYAEPLNQQQLNLKLMDLKNKLQEQKKGMSAEELSFLKDQLMPMQTAQAFANRQKIANDRMVFQAQKNIVEGIKKNPQDAKLVAQSNNIVNTLTSMSAGDITTQNFHEIQQAARNNIGLKGQSGVGERAETYLDSMGLRGTALGQFLTATPEDIRNHGGQKYLDHLQSMMQTEMQNVQQQRKMLVDKLSGGYGDLLDRPENADKKAAIAKLVEASIGQTTDKPLPRISKLKETQMINPVTKKVQPAPYQDKKAITNTGAKKPWEMYGGGE